MLDRLTACHASSIATDSQLFSCEAVTRSGVSEREPLLLRLADITAILALVLFPLSHLSAAFVSMGLVGPLSNSQGVLLVVFLYGISGLLVILSWAGWRNRKDKPGSGAGAQPE